MPPALAGMTCNGEGFLCQEQVPAELFPTFAGEQELIIYRIANTAEWHLRQSLYQNSVTSYRGSCCSSSCIEQAAK